jgi:hypothetical protein
VALEPNAVIALQLDAVLQKTVTSLGVLKDEAAQADWEWKGSAQRMNLAAAVAAFRTEVKEYPKWIKSLELFGA